MAESIMKLISDAGQVPHPRARPGKETHQACNQRSFGDYGPGLPNLVRTNKRADLAALQLLIGEREVGSILLGNPINMRGTEKAGNPNGCMNSLRR